LDAFLRHLFRLAFHAGSLGLLTVGILDSSFLMLPLGNDVLLLALAARYHDRVALYVAAATLGSVLGVLLTLWLSRKGGDRLAKGRRGRTWKYVEKQMKENAAWALTIGSLMPPPFPFTVFVAAAGALKVPPKKALSYIAAGRLLRFTIEGVLAIYYGRWILSFAQSSAFRDVAIAMFVVAVAGSTYSIYGWVRH
jgi:membrane protein YqaA with SNARE-associated domain